MVGDDVRRSGTGARSPAAPLHPPPLTVLCAVTPGGGDGGPTKPESLGATEMGAKKSEPTPEGLAPPELCAVSVVWCPRRPCPRGRCRRV